MSERGAIEVAGIVFAESKRGGTFTAREFTEFLTMAGEAMHEERGAEILDDLVLCCSLREIGPGVYAALEADAKASAAVEHPIW